MAVQKNIKIGTRGSDLAIAQTNQVITALEKQFFDIRVEKVILHTKGDKILDKPLPDFGGKGVFVTEFEEALLDGRIDLAVHSAKDMPTELGNNLAIAGVLPREDARDVLVMRKGRTTDRPVIGTGSLRRQLQMKKLYPKAVCKGLRGNVPTRLEKLRQGEYDGVILAVAGLKRLGLLEEADLEYRYLSYDEMIPAGGQGIIAVEGREGDAITKMVQEISDKTAFAELKTEREILRRLDAGCHEAVGVVSQFTENMVRIRVIQEVEGRILREDETAKPEQVQELIKELTMRIKEKSRAGE